MQGTMLFSLAMAALVAAASARILPKFPTDGLEKKANQSLLLAIGGYAGRSETDDIEIYSLSKKSALDAGANMPEPRDGFGNAVFNNTFYVLGGWDGHTVHDNFWAYDIVKDQWKDDLPKVPTPSFGSAAVELGGRIYVLGGERGPNDPIKEVYAFATRLRKWYTIKTPLPETAEYPCATVQEKNLWYMSASNLYHSGDGAVTWKKLPSPKQARDQADCIAVGTDAILFTGGRVNGEAVNTVELFNITTNKWKTVAPLKMARQGLSSAQIPDSKDVVVCGGQKDDNDTDIMTSCEVYDWENNKWNTADYQLQNGRVFFGLFTTQAKV